MTHTQYDNADPAELEKFGALAASWWDPKGHSKPLHDLNPVRLQFIKDHAELNSVSALDVGCGGGLLSEALAENGASVTAIDLSLELLQVARLHLYETPGLEVNYQQISVEQLLAESTQRFQMISCMEMLEHVPDPSSIVAACAQLLVPGGKVFFSTLNRNFKAFAVAIVGAEYVMQLLPKGTHEYQKFIRPSELCTNARANGLELLELKGMQYDPFSGKAGLCRKPDVNYLACFQKSL